MSECTTQGPSLRIESLGVDDSGAQIALGQRCIITQVDNEIILDRVLLDCIRQHLDNDCDA